MPLYKLMPKLFTCEFTSDMSMSVITSDETAIAVEGEFRKFKDYGALSWSSEDNRNHPYCKYPTSYDFSGVTLEYDYAIEGDLAELGDPQAGQSLIVKLKNDNTHYIVNLWYYDVTRPQTSWEKTKYDDPLLWDVNENETILWPNKKRCFGEGNGRYGRIFIDFDDLYAGWAPFEIGARPLDDGSPKYVWKKANTWVKLDPTQIEQLKWSFAPKKMTFDGYLTTANDEYLWKNRSFKMLFKNWQVSGNIFLRDLPLELAPHPIKMCDDYDDMYFMTPEWLIEQFKILGFREIINFYIGASHFYTKTYNGSKFVLDERYVFNNAFRSWFENYLKFAKQHGFTEVIASISMENVDAADSWAQQYFDNTIARSGWEPPPKFLSFCNEDVINFYKRYVAEIANIQKSAGYSTVCIQLGEPWWWSGTQWHGANPNFTILPCIYDKATQEKFKLRFGHPIPSTDVIPDSHMSDEEVLWFAAQIGEFMVSLIQHLTNLLHDRKKLKFGVLFFPPSVSGPGIPEMIEKINLPIKYWSFSNSPNSLDFFQIEDYDYLIHAAKHKYLATRLEPNYIRDRTNQQHEAANYLAEHQKLYQYAETHLNYPKNKIHYFAGFVRYKAKFGFYIKDRTPIETDYTAINANYNSHYVLVQTSEGAAPQELYFVDNSGQNTLIHRVSSLPDYNLLDLLNALFPNARDYHYIDIPELSPRQIISLTNFTSFDPKPIEYEHQKYNNFLWAEINQSLKDSLQHEQESFIWASTQVFRDNWIFQNSLFKTPNVLFAQGERNNDDLHHCNK